MRKKKMMKDNYYYEFDDYKRKVDYLTLEQKIMAAWLTVDDIKALYRSSEGMNQDQITNALLGLEIFASMRFEELWDCFEQLLHNQRKDKGLETPTL
jgi:hypothetical protein